MPITYLVCKETALPLSPRELRLRTMMKGQGAQKRKRCQVKTQRKERADPHQKSEGEEQLVLKK